MLTPWQAFLVWLLIVSLSVALGYIQDLKARLVHDPVKENAVAALVVCNSKKEAHHVSHP